MARFVPWTLFSDIDAGRNPCACCSPMNAWTDDDIWVCRGTQQQWRILDQPVDLRQPHPVGYCDGNRCPFHPLLTPTTAELGRVVECGMSWGDLVYEDERAALAAETPAQKAAREAKYQAEQQKFQLDLEARRMEKLAEMNEFRSKKGLRKGEKLEKVACPCKQLYSCVGKPARPTTLHVSSQCFGWDYTDPFGVRRTPKTCIWLHPGEEGWQKEWDTNRNWRPAGQEEGGWRSGSGSGSSSGYTSSRGSSQNTSRSSRSSGGQSYNRSHFRPQQPPLEDGWQTAHNGGRRY